MVMIMKLVLPVPWTHICILHAYLHSWCFLYLPYRLVTLIWVPSGTSSMIAKTNALDACFGLNHIGQNIKHVENQPPWNYRSWGHG